jgi:arabinose-5-phosphate isomerase
MNFQALLLLESVAIRCIPVENYEEVFHLVNHVSKNNGKVITTGIGKAGLMAKNLASTFCSTGIPSVYLHPCDALHGDLGIATNLDLLIIFSNSGETDEIIEMIKALNCLYPDIGRVCITSNPLSTIGIMSDIVLATGNPKEVCPLELTPTTSITVMSVISDILVTGVMDITGFTYSEYFARHHAGYLGQEAKKKI